MSLYAVPRLGLTDQHPHAAVYPIVVASSNREARDHAIDLWHLPHFMEDIGIEFTPSPDGQSMTGKVCCHQGKPIVQLTVSQTGAWKPVYQLYQSFQGDESGSYMGIMDMRGHSPTGKCGCRQEWKAITELWRWRSRSYPNHTS